MEFEVFVPVVGEFIVRVEADSTEEAIRLIADGEVDFAFYTASNVEIDERFDISAEPIL